MRSGAPYDPSDERSTCDGCEGTGEILSQQGGGLYTQPCPDCRGRGWRRVHQRERAELEVARG